MASRPGRPFGLTCTSADAAAARRADQARPERAAGRNPQALHFPGQKGGMLWPSGFSTDLVVPAMKAAGWTYEMVHEVRTVRRG